MSAPPITRTRLAKIRAIQPGQSIVVHGKADVVCVAAHRALGRGNYQVRQLARAGGPWCRVWHLSDEQRQLKPVNVGSEP